MTSDPPVQALRCKKASGSKLHSSLLTGHPQKSNGPPNGELCSPSSPSSYTPSPVTPHSPPSTLSQDRVPPGTSSDGTTIVEIEDPSLKPNRCEHTVQTPPTTLHTHMCTISHAHTHRGSRQKDHTPSGFVLPSPLLSILGPKRTLNLLSESVSSESGRPVRRARMRPRGEGEWGRGAREKAKAQQESEQKER